MPSRRIARLNEHIKREVSEIIRRDVRDPRVGRPTVTDVNVTRDLYSARIYVRPDPTLEAAEGSGLLEGLEQASPFIRRELAKSMRARRVPELRFEADRVLDRASRIEAILREVLPAEVAEGEGDGGAGDRGSPVDLEGGRDAGDTGG
jgi:ribosome-binding factor A